MSGQRLGFGQRPYLGSYGGRRGDEKLVVVLTCHDVGECALTCGERVCVDGRCGVRDVGGVEENGG